jgi:hypothetical protein
VCHRVCVRGKENEREIIRREIISLGTEGNEIIKGSCVTLKLNRSYGLVFAKLTDKL